MIVFDIECYTNYFLIMMQSEKGSIRHWEMHNDNRPDMSSLRGTLKKHTIVSFNGNSYDVPMLLALLYGYSNEQLKELSDYLITVPGAKWKWRKVFDVNNVKMDHIDLIEVAPGMASLKVYGGRLHAPKLQDLPIELSATISDNDAQELRTYCINDLETTRLLLNTLEKQIDLRVRMSEDYSADLRSKSDAQIAESVINDALKGQGVIAKRPDIEAGTAYKYKTPDFIEFKHPELVKVLSDIEQSLFVVKDNGSIQMPDALNNRLIPVGYSKYRMGIGGLHSTEKKQTVVCDEDHLLFDTDVASYYPNIILGESLFPRHLSAKFLDIYGMIVNRRLKAKAEGDKVTADSLKITINGSFGKLGSKYSTLYSPDLLIQVTITGQLSLLMLIEQIESIGAQVVSANTDGIVTLCPKELYQQVCDAVMRWEFSTGYDMEETRYKGIYSRDVNNYIAVCDDGKTKGKGAYASPGLMKNPNNLICVSAVVEYLTNRTPVEQTIYECDDLTQFVTIRAVKGGAVKGDDFLGKTVRWYYSDSIDGTINYKTNGNKVPRSEGAKPCLQLPYTLPGDIDYQWYINESKTILHDIGVIDEGIDDRKERDKVCRQQGLFEL